jgi:hypothetical protein
MRHLLASAFLWVALAAMLVQTVASWISEPANGMSQGNFLLLAVAAAGGLVVTAGTAALLIWQLTTKRGANFVTALAVLPSLLWHGFALLTVTGAASREYLFWVNVVPESTFNVVYHAVLCAVFAIALVVSLLRPGAGAPQRAEHVNLGA